MKRNTIGINVLLFSFFLALPVQGSSNSSVSDESLDPKHGGVTASMPGTSVGNKDAQPADEDWEKKARELRLWTLQRDRFRQGKISGATYAKFLEDTYR